LLALKELEREGVLFDILWSRGPFFLRGGKREIDEWYASMGLPNDAPRWKVAQIKGMNDAPIDALYAQAGMSPRNSEATDTKVWTETLTAHRLSQYAATESSEKGEAMWSAISRRFFMGKDTAIRPIRLDSHELLMECAAAAELDPKAARQVIDGDAFEEQVYAAVRQVHAAGVHSIPVLIFEVDGLAAGSWLTHPKDKFRRIHHGSGNNSSFREVLEELHFAACR